MKYNKTAIIGIALGLGAGISYGVYAVLAKYAVGEISTPLVGAAISLLIGTFFLGIFGLRGIRAIIDNNRKEIGYMLLSGFASACGLIASFFALTISPVVIVSPLQSTHPLFALLFSWLFLGRLEKITVKMIIGCVFVVTGVILITLGRAA